MKIFVLLLCLPVVFSASKKRMIFDSISSAFDLESLKADLQIMLDVLGKDPTEVACEAECHNIIAQGHVLNYGCPLVCHAFQDLIQTFHITKPKPTVAGRKRMVFDSIGSFFDFSTLKADLQIMVDVLGSDPTEVACEQECHNLLASGHVLNYGCPFVCHAFQTLVGQLHIKPKPTVAGRKRMILDTVGSFFDFSTLKADLQIMVDVLGSDPTETACEQECHKLLSSGHVLNYGCPFVCHAFQTLVQQLHLTTPKPMVTGGKRMILDTVGSLFDFSTLKADLQIMVDVLGSDPTETACEQECHKLLSSGHVLNYGCPFVCHAFQTLVQQLHLTTPKPMVTGRK